MCIEICHHLCISIPRNPTQARAIRDDLPLLPLEALDPARYLDVLADLGFLRKRKIGRVNYFINEPLVRILIDETLPSE